MPEWIIGYDICDPRRLGRVYRVMLKHATPIEYSIFLFSGTQNACNECMKQISSLIEKNDDLRCYPLPNRGFQTRLGKATLPQGIHWSALPTQLQDYLNLENVIITGEEN